MLRRLTKLITNNFGLKVLAAVFAVVLWLVVMNTEDPDKTKGFTIPVSIENVQYLTEMGKTYEILNNTGQISFWVTGKRSIIEELSESDFTATANMENINEDLSMVPVTVTASRYSNQIEISKKDSFMKISVENLITDQIEISTVIEGTPAENCYVSRTKATPEKVTVTGPQSVVEQIATAQVTVNVEKAEEDIATNGDIVLLDSSGEVVSQERLNLNRTVAAVDIVIMMEKSVPIQFETTGEPAEGYRYAGVSSTVSEVKLTGPTELLDSLESLDIESSQLNMAGAAADFKAVVNIRNYLPVGVSLADGEPGEAEVTVQIEGQDTEVFEVPVDNITVEGLAEDLELSFDSDTVTVKLMGFPEQLEEIDASGLMGTLDASAFSAGNYSAVVQIQGDYTAADVVHAAVTVKERGSGGDAGSAGNPGTTSSEGNNAGSDENGEESGN